MMEQAPSLKGCERRRLTGDERRAAILQAARGAFARHGFHGAGTSEIAALAGCSEPMIYKHFPSKQALFAAVLEDATYELRERIHTVFESRPDNVDELDLMAGLVERLCGDEVMLEVSRLRMLAVTLVDDPEIRAALDLSLSGMRQRVVRLIAEGQAEGRVRADVDNETVSWLWIGFVMAAAYRF